MLRTLRCDLRSAMLDAALKHLDASLVVADWSLVPPPAGDMVKCEYDVPLLTPLRKRKSLCLFGKETFHCSACLTVENDFPEQRKSFSTVSNTLAACRLKAPPQMPLWCRGDITYLLRLRALWNPG